MVVKTGAIVYAKLQSNRHHQQTFLQAGCPSCHPTNSVIALKGRRNNTRYTKYNYTQTPPSLFSTHICQEIENCSKLLPDEQLMNN